MNTIECIKTRRSKRKYLDKEVSDKIIEKIIDAARHAPSSQDSQPWEFIIVRDKESKKRLAKLKGEENEKCILGSGVIIVVCIDMEKSPTRWVEDGVTATENILLAAHDLGLGAVYVTGFKSSKSEIGEEIKKILNLPEKIMPITILPIGYPDPSKELEKKKLREIKEIMHKEKW